MEDHTQRLPLLSRDLSSKVEFSVPLPNDEIYCSEQKKSSDTSTRMIFLRLFLVVFIGCISLWASNEANKGFQVTILNDARDYSPAGRKFHLLYVSNDRATRLVLEASQFVESLLYSSQTNRKKQVNHVIFRLASQNLTQLVSVDSSYEEGKFVINLSRSIMEEKNVKVTMLQAIGQGMARVWIFDNSQYAPRFLINGLVEYISRKLAHMSTEVDSDPGSQKPGQKCWEYENTKAVARFLSYCEEHRTGFIQRLNQAMSDRSNWHDRFVDDALGMSAQLLCSSYMSRELLLSNSLYSSSDEML